MKAILTPFLTALLAFAVTAQDATNAKAAKPKRELTDRELVEAAVRDYVEGIYDVQPARIAKSVSTDLYKVGFWRETVEKEYGSSPMTFDKLKTLAANYNKNGKRIAKDAPKKIEVLGVLPRVAIAKLTASWGIDYLQLEKTATGWKTRHVIWQSNPKGTPEATTADKAAVKRAALDYATAFYTAEPKLIEGAVHEKLAKYGYYNGRAMPMNFDQLKDLSKQAYKNGAPANAMKVAEVLDCLDKIACVKLTGAWGIDYMSLHKDGDDWKIREVIWQSHPRKKNKKK